MLQLQWLLLLPRAHRCSSGCCSCSGGLINCSAFTGGACTDLLLLLLLLLLMVLSDARRYPLHCCRTTAGDHAHLHGFVGRAFNGLDRVTAATAVRCGPPWVVPHAGHRERSWRLFISVQLESLRSRSRRHLFIAISPPRDDRLWRRCR